MVYGLIFFRLLGLALAGALVACASGMSGAECAGADWAALGLADGRAGAGPALFEERREDCADAAAPAAFAAYEEARAEGLKSYCAPGGGFAAGKAGGDYAGVCAGAGEQAFLEDFALGARLHQLTEAKETAIRNYERAAADLDQHRYLLAVAEKRYAKPSISNEDREQERQDAEFRRREIARIEAKLPAMLGAIEKARAALEAYRVELLEQGREI